MEALHYLVATYNIFENYMLNSHVIHMPTPQHKHVTSEKDDINDKLLTEFVDNHDDFLNWNSSAGLLEAFLITPKGQGSSYTSIKQDGHASSKSVVILNVQILLTTNPEEPAEDNECG